MLATFMMTGFFPLAAGGGGGGDGLPMAVGLAAILVLGVGAQWMAWRLRLPSILLLLAFGFLAGPVALWALPADLEAWALRPEALLGGDLLLSLVSLAVGLILFEGGLTLTFHEIKNVRRAVLSLVTVGAIVTWIISTLAAGFVLGLNWPVATLLGAVLIVTGPTVIGPLLRFVRPTGSVGKVLKWEGIVIDPIGAMAAVLVYEAILAGQTAPGASAAFAFGWGALKVTLLGTGIGLAAAWLLVFLLRRYLIPDHLQVPVTLMFVAAAFVASNQLVPESGLFTTTVMGIALANQKSAHIRHIVEFKETLVVLLIAALFIVLSARLDLASLETINWLRAAGFMAIVVFVARPAAVFLSTARSTLTWHDKVFLSWMAPRGIVAAAVASVFGLGLTNQGVPGADLLVPYTFLVIVVTVALYGLTAAYMATRLGLARPGSAGFLIVGAHPTARELALAFKEMDLETLLVDTNYLNVQQARLQGLNALVANALSPSVAETVELTSIGRLLALTGNKEVNNLACVHFGRHFGRSEVYELANRTKKAPGRQGDTDDDVQGRILFGEDVTFQRLAELRDAGAEVRVTKLSKEFTYKDWRREHGEDALPMATVTEDGGIEMFTAADGKLTPKSGQKLVGLVIPKPKEKRAPKPTPEPDTIDAAPALAGA